MVPYSGANRLNFSNTTSGSKIKERKLVLILRRLPDQAEHDSMVILSLLSYRDEDLESRIRGSLLSRAPWNTV